ncbi:MAG: alpha/beta hydrolase [Anaerolineae bacterium]
MDSVTPQLIRIAARSVRVWGGGTGPALLLLHGGIGDAEQHWAPVWDQLAADFTIAAPDFPGFGGSAPLPDARFGDWVEWTLRVIELLNLQEVSLVGNSFGAGLARLVAAKYPDRVRRLVAAKYPDRVRRLVLVDGGHINTLPALLRPLLLLPIAPPLVEWVRKQAFSPDGLHRMVFNESLLTPEFIANAEAGSHAYVSIMRQALLGDLPPEQTPRGPTLVIWGAEDRLSSLDRGRAIAAAIPGSALRIMPAAAHMPQIEQPEEFVRLVKEFCIEKHYERNLSV